MTPIISLPDDQKPQPDDKVSEGMSSGNRDRGIESKQEPVVSDAEKVILETRHGSGLLQVPSTSCRHGKPKLSTGDVEPSKKAMKEDHQLNSCPQVPPFTYMQQPGSFPLFRTVTKPISSYSTTNKRDSSIALIPPKPQCSSNELNDTPLHRTLPNLLEEIISKDKNIKFDEICIAVFPHWDHLRKRNGKRYADSNHRHAVYSSLNNRRGWAHYIPKTYQKKKKLKLDAAMEDSYESYQKKNKRKLFAAMEEESHEGESKRVQNQLRRKLRNKTRQEVNEEEERLNYS